MWAKRGKVDQLLKSMELQGNVMEPSNSPWASNFYFLLVLKENTEKTNFQMHHLANGIFNIFGGLGNDSNENNRKTYIGCCL